MRLRKWTAFGLVAAVVLLSAQQASAGYSKWKYNKSKKRAECTYSYTNKSGGTSYNTVIRYPKSDDRAGWDYFFNAKNACWAKCMNKRHPDYNPRQMQWALCEPDGKEKKKLPPGDCPTPKDGVKPVTEDVPDVMF